MLVSFFCNDRKTFFSFAVLCSSSERCFIGKSATDAVRRAIERISDTGKDRSPESREPKPAARVAWELPPCNIVLPSNHSTLSASDATSSMLHSADPSYLDPSFWLTSFGAQNNNDVSTDSMESEGETHAPQVSNISAFPRSPQAAREPQSTRSSISASSASASNSSIRDAIESYRKATMFVMPVDISSDSSDGGGDSRNFAANAVISSDSESEQSERVDNTIDYLNRRVRIEHDQLLRIAGNRARSSQSLNHYNIEQSQSQRPFSKPQSHRRVVFADSPSAKTSNSRVVPHELKYVHIVAETQRRWKNLPEVCPNCSEILWYFHASVSAVDSCFVRCSVKCMLMNQPSLLRLLGRKQN
jgi:hypothetical protein